MTGPPNRPRPADPRPMSTEKWIVRFRLCDLRWADANRDRNDFTNTWDYIPWHPELTEAVHLTEEAARDQYDTLRTWETERAQPVMDVTLHRVIAPATEEQL